MKISGTPYDPEDPDFSGVKAIETKTLDATAYTHPKDEQSGPKQVWDNETGTHAHSYPIKAYYFPTEQDDPDFMLGGEPIEVGEFQIYIGVKGDVNLDDVADVADAQLVLNYYTAKVVAHKDVDKINPSRNDLDEFEGVDRLCYFLGDVAYKDENGNIADPTSLDVIDAQLILNYYTKKDVAHKDTSWEEVVGYDLLDSFYGDKTE